MVNQKVAAQQIITFVDQKFATGLFWQPVEEGSPAEEARKISESIMGEGEFFAYREIGAPQIGLGFKSKGHTAGMPVAALQILDKLTDVPSILAAFRVPEGIWILAIRNALILAEEDVLILNEADAQQAFQELMSLPDWSVKYAPKSWGIEGAQDIELKDLISTLSPIERLRPLNTRGKKLMRSMILIVILLVGSYFGWQVYHRAQVVKQEKIMAAAKLAEAARLAKLAANGAAKRADVLVAPPQPYTQIFDRADFTRFCTTWLALLYEPLPGWSVSEMHCDKSSAVVKLQSSLGAIVNVKNVMTQKYKDHVDVQADASGTMISLVVPLDKNLKPLSEVPTLTAAEWTNQFNQFFSVIDAKVSLAEKTESIYNPKNSQLKTTFSYISVQFTSSIDPSEWGKAFEKLKGFEFTTIRWSNKQWSYEGRAYVKP